MLVTMTATRVCYPDGVTQTLCRKGETYDFHKAIAANHIARGLSTPVETAVVVGDLAADEPTVVAADPLAGLNARDAVAAVAGLSLDELDAIADSEDRTTVLHAIERRREQLEPSSS